MLLEHLLQDVVKSTWKRAQHSLFPMNKSKDSSCMLLQSKFFEPSQLRFLAIFFVQKNQRFRCEKLIEDASANRILLKSNRNKNHSRSESPSQLSQ